MPPLSPSTRPSILSVRTRPVLRAAAALALAAGLAAPAAFGQSSSQPGTSVTDNRVTDLQLLRDFSHYVRIDANERAIATGQQLLDRGLKPADFAALVDDSPEAQRFEETIIRAQKKPEVETIAAQLLALYEQGKLDQARDPAAISKNISLLTGTSRQRQFAVDRLIAAGEYAMPQLLNALINRRDPLLQAEVRQVIVALRRQAIIPLATALPGLDPSSQEIVVGVLGDLGYLTSLPYLYDLHQSTTVDSVRRAIETAVTKLAGEFRPGVSVAGLYLALGEEFYTEPPSLTSFRDEEHQLLWTFDPGLGLVPQAILTEVYHEAMAMRCAERALAIEPASSAALSLWLSANFSREIDSPAGYENPAYGSDRRDATYYAVAAGPAPCERVLARGLVTRDTPLARRAIAAIERTAGPAAMFSGGGGANSLLEALRYPSRRVQYEAAMAIGAAQPRQPFTGSDRVVPILASAVRDAAARFAVVVASDTEKQTSIAETLRSRGYTVLPPVSQLAAAEAAIAEAPGVDIIVCDLTASATETLINTARGMTRLAATPVLALSHFEDFVNLTNRFDRDPGVRIARAGIDSDQLGEAVDQLLEASVGGPITAEEAHSYKERALAVLRDLAVSGNSVLNVSDASLPLIGALFSHQGDLRLRIAEVLSYINSKRAQVAIMDAALQDQGTDRVAMLGLVAESAKRNGNLLEPRQVDRVIEMARTGDGEEATAAAALMGALNLPNDQLIPLILSAK